MKIGICDDENVQLAYLNMVIGEWAKGKRVICETKLFVSAEQLLFEYPDSIPLDLLILDIQMGKMNGMELARELRIRDKELKILFLTGVKDYVFEGYEVGALRYLVKPVKEDQLMDILEEVYKQIKDNPRSYFIFTYLGEPVKIAYEDILYITVEGHYLHMVTLKSEYDWKESLSAMRELLELEDFILSHRSAIINIRHVDKIKKEECIMSNGQYVPISRGNYKEVNQAFIRYYMGEK
jgi:DNA-binding LytR/AlgR family response regulator